MSNAQYPEKTDLFKNIPERIELPVGGHLMLSGGFVTDPEKGAMIEAVSADPEITTADEWSEVQALAEGSTTVTLCCTQNPQLQREILVTVTKAPVMRTIYVATDGKGDGSRANPTDLEGAMSILAGIDKVTMTGNVEVILSGGYYYREKTLALNDNHGGNNRYSVIFKAAAGERVTIGGAFHIPGASFRPVEGCNGIYVADLPKGVTTRQVYVDNVRAQRARSKGSFRNMDYLYDEAGSPIGILCDNEELLTFAHPEELELVYVSLWTHQRVRVQEIRPTEDGRVALIMAQPGWKNSNVGENAMGFGLHKVKYYENALELLDKPGQWYLDEAEHKLYYMPRSFEDMSRVTVTVAALDVWDAAENQQAGLVSVQGSDIDHPVQNICFEGITFADATWMRPSTGRGHIANQNNHIRDDTGLGLSAGQYDNAPDGAITVRRTNGIRFTGCDFARIGITALRMTDATKNALVAGNRFYDLSGNAIQVGEPDYTRNTDNYRPTDHRKITKNICIRNNYIHDIGVDFQSAAAIGIGFIPNVQIVHNDIFNTNFSSLHIGLGWNNKFINVMKNMVISHNMIHDSMFAYVNDVGLIYTVGVSAPNGNNKILRNYLRNQGGTCGALYFDQGSSYWTAEKNVMDVSETRTDPRNGKPIFWLHFNNGSDLQVADNYYEGGLGIGGSPVEEHDWQATRFENNVRVPDLNWPEEARAIMEAAGLEGAYRALQSAHAERIYTNLTKGILTDWTKAEHIVVDLQETFQIRVTATDGKDRPVSGFTAYYDVEDPSVASVDDTGLVTGLKAGKTGLRIYVLSDNVLKMIRTEINVADKLSAICFENISGPVRTYTVADAKMTLKPYGLTEQGRKIPVEDLTYEIGNRQIVTVGEENTLTLLTAGQTTLTVTGTGEGTSVTTTHTFVSVPVDTPDMGELFTAESQSLWTGKDMDDRFATVLESGDTGMTATMNGFRTYTGRKFGNQLLSFYVKLQRRGNWPCICFRVQQTDNAVALGATGYSVCFTPAETQLHRFNGRERTMIYGTTNGHFPLVPDKFPNLLADGGVHKIQLGAINEDCGVRVLMYVDGKAVFDYLDTDPKAIREDGYFGLIGTANLDKQPDIFTLTNKEAL